MIHYCSCSASASRMKKIGYVKLGFYFCMTGVAMRCSTLAIDVQIDIFLAKAAFGKHGVQCMLLGLVCIQDSNARSLLSLVHNIDTETQSCI